MGHAWRTSVPSTGGMVSRPGDYGLTFVAWCLAGGREAAAADGGWLQNVPRKVSSQLHASTVLLAAVGSFQVCIPGLLAWVDEGFASEQNGENGKPFYNGPRIYRYICRCRWTPPQLAHH